MILTSTYSSDGQVDTVLKVLDLWADQPARYPVEGLRDYRLNLNGKISGHGSSVLRNVGILVIIYIHLHSPVPRLGYVQRRDIRLRSYAVQVIWLFTRTSVLGVESYYIVVKKPD